MPGMPGVRPVEFTLHNTLTGWDVPPLPAPALASGARPRCGGGGRTVSFLAGLVALDLALQSPVATFSMGYFQAHVVQHLLLMVVAPPLLALGAPMTLALQTSRRETKVRLLGLLNSRPFRLLTHPLPVWCLYYFSMFAF